MLPYNDIDAVQQTFARFGEQIAAVITEASPGNMGVVPPGPGFNAALRAITAEHGALLILDEVMTGFRSAEVVGTESIRCPLTCSPSAR